MRIGFIQMTPIWGDINRNLEIITRLVSGVNADLMVLPEFFNTGYLFVDPDEVSRLSEEIPGGPTTQFLSDLSKKTGTIFVGGLPERHGEFFYNSAVMTTPDGGVSLYRKTHLFDRECLYFQPGDTGFNVFEVAGVRIGIMICFDWIFPESCRALALNGADIIVHPSNLVLPYCPKAMVTRCLENHVFAVTCNRAGSENRDNQQLDFIGNSRIISPSGEVIGRADKENERICVVDIDPRESRNKQLTSHNHLFRDQRPEFYRYYQT